MAPILPEAALAQHIAILGKTGSGKTSTAKLIVEQVVAGKARVCILDPIKSDWWGLTSSSDGKHPGLPFYILGGPRAHVPLHASSGKAIAELVASGAMPLSIIDMADFAPGGQAQFFVDFAPALLRKMRGVVYLVVEEAHLFAPKERSGMGSENLSIHWAKTLATAGRSKGIRIMLCTQRTQALHNALLGSCDTMIAQRMTAPADKKPVLEWFKDYATPEAHKAVSESLAALPTGTGWVYSGEAGIFEKRQFPRIQTYDNSKTPTGTEEEHAIESAPVDQHQLRALLGDAVAEVEANDPKKLKARIAELEQQGIGTGDGYTKADLDAEHARGRVEGYSAGVSDAKSAILGPIQTAKTAVDDIWQALKPLGHEADQALVSPAAAPTATASVQTAASRPPQAPHRPSSGQPTPSHPDIGKSGLQRILIALAQRPQGLTRRQIGVRAGISSGSGTFSTYLSKARSSGWIEAGQVVTITPAGIKALGTYQPLPAGRELLRYWLNDLGSSGAARLLTALANCYPRTMSRELAAKAADMSPDSGTFSTYLSKLRTLELIEGRDQLKASAEFFE